jgi:phosphatidylinositol alpha-1,6-mannosyltransferase
MRILLITDYYLPHAGGARVYYHNMYRSLWRELGDDVTILTKKVPGWRDFDRAESGPGLRIIRRFTPLPSWKYWELPKAALPLAGAIGQLIRRRPDIIHFGDLYPPGMICLWIKKTFGIPYIGYCHGEEITQTELRRYQPRVRDAIYRNANLVVAASAYARAQLLRIGIPDAQIRTITPGVDYERFRSQPRVQDLVRRCGAQDKRVLLTVARLVPRKGHLAVMQAVARLRAELPDIRYMIVGTGSAEAALRTAAAEYGIADAVHFTGFVPEADLPGYYNLCDVFVMPNYEEAATGDIEGFGMVFLEANAAGKPVIGGRSGGTAEAIVEGITGFRVDPADTGELTARIRELLASPALRERMGNQGQARSRAMFSWANRAQMLHALSEEVLMRIQPGGAARPVLTRPE